MFEQSHLFERSNILDASDNVNLQGHLFSVAIKSTGAETATVAGTRPAPKEADLRMRLPFGGRLSPHDLDALFPQ